MDDAMVAASYPRWIQGEFITLVGLFNGLVLNTNVKETVVMVFRLCQVTGTQLEAAYRRHMMGAGPSYRYMKQVRVQCTECGEEMALGFLTVYL